MVLAFNRWSPLQAGLRRLVAGDADPALGTVRHGLAVGGSVQY